MPEYNNPKQHIAALFNFFLKNNKAINIITVIISIK